MGVGGGAGDGEGVAERRRASGGVVELGECVDVGVVDAASEERARARERRCGSECGCRGVWQLVGGVVVRRRGCEFGCEGERVAGVWVWGELGWGCGEGAREHGWDDWREGGRERVCGD